MKDESENVACLVCKELLLKVEDRGGEAVVCIDRPLLNAFEKRSLAHKPFPRKRGCRKFFTRRRCLRLIKTFVQADRIWRGR